LERSTGAAISLVSRLLPWRKTNKERVLERMPDARLQSRYRKVRSSHAVIEVTYMVTTETRILSAGWPSAEKAWDGAFRCLVTGKRQAPAPIAKRTETKRGKRR